MDEFLYCYKPFEISQSLGFYQFFERGSNCRLVRSLPSSDRRWKTEFFFVSGNPVEVGKTLFLPTLVKWVIFVQRVCHFYTLYYFSLSYLSNAIFCLLFFGCETTFFVQILSRLRPASSFFVDRTFHCLMTLRCLASWGLGPEPFEEALAHELTTRRRKLSLLFVF